MRILQVITPARLAGAERSMLSLCEHQARAGHEVLVVSRPGSPVLEAAAELGLAAEAAGIVGKLNPIAAVRLARIARRFRADVIHTHLSTASLWGGYAGLLAGVPSVGHVRALNTATCFHAARRLIAVSRAVKAHLVEQGVPPDRIDVVYTGVDPARYEIPFTRAAGREQLGLPADAVLIGVAAHLSRRKGHAVLLEALTLLRDPRARLVLVGDGPKRPALEKQAAELGVAERVTFAGYQRDVLPWYAALDIVALPAVSGEGLPRTLLEAGFVGLPAVASRISGTPEIIEEGRTGYLVPRRDPAALAARLRELVGDARLRERLGAAARERVRRVFTVAAMVEGTLATYGRAGVGGAGEGAGLEIENFEL